MTTLLNITSSLHGPKGQSSQLAERYVAAWRTRHPAPGTRLAGSSPAIWLRNPFRTSPPSAFRRF